MADEKKTVTLVAVERGFREGRLFEPGEKFPFPEEAKRPKWAVPENDPSLVRPKKKEVAGDLRPKDAQAASKGKAAVLANDLAG